MYTERLLDHFRNPRNVGELGPPALTADVSNPACGDLLRLSIELENGVIKRARYKVKGCTASIAAGSALTSWLEGKTTSEARAVKPADIEEALGGLEAASKHAAVLCVDAVRALIQ